MSRSPDRDALLARDTADPLAVYRRLFHLPEGLLYFNGNSLGPLPIASRQRVVRLLDEEWGTDLVAAWNRHGWLDLAKQVAHKIAPLIGAAPDEVAVSDSTSVNLFKLLATAVELRPDRRILLTEEAPFPTDAYIADGLAQLLARGHELRYVPSDAIERHLEEATAGEEVAVVLLSHVDYRHGALLDMARLTRAAHAHGAVVVWDLSHSAGALAVDLDGCDVEMAVGCGYKFLNGGPGAPSFLYVARRLHERARSPLSGWFGHRDPFAFDRDFTPAEGVDRYLCGTQPVLSLASLDAAIDLFADVDLQELRHKSIALGELLLALVGERCGDSQLSVASPATSAHRGSQISFRHPHAYAVVRALSERRVVVDFRHPDLLRFGLTPLYQRYVDVWDAVDILAEILAQRRWQEDLQRQPGVAT